MKRLLITTFTLLFAVGAMGARPSGLRRAQPPKTDGAKPADTSKPGEK